MINPKFIEEYGEEGVKFFTDFGNSLSEHEKDSIYACDHNILSPVRGAPLFIASTDNSLIAELSEKIMQYAFSLDGDTILFCEDYRGEGIKVWLTT